MDSSNSILSVCMHDDVLSIEYSRVYMMILLVWFGDISLKKENRDLASP